MPSTVLQNAPAISTSPYVSIPSKRCINNKYDTDQHRPYSRFPSKTSFCCFDFQAALDSSSQITPRKTPQRRSGIGEDLRNAQPLEERLFQMEQRIKNEARRPLRRVFFFRLDGPSRVKINDTEAFRCVFFVTFVLLLK